MIPKTKIHYQRLANQINILLINLQRDIVSNAEAHKTMAQAQSPDIATLKQFVTDSTTAYQKSLKRLADLRGSSTKRQDFINILTLVGYTEDDVMNIYTPLKQVVDMIQDAPKENWQDIINLSNTIINIVDKPLTAWEE